VKISVAWLREFVPFTQSPEELANLLRGLGFDTASLTTVGGPVTNVVTARVEVCGKHPNADRLSLCTVFDGTDRFQVVCGAPNVGAGKIVPLARVGAVLPGGMTIQKAKLRGVESSGMLCSARELGLGDDHSGLFLLPEDTPLGEDIAKTLSLGDTVLDVEVTPNRPDVLSHWGVAREVAAVLGLPLTLPPSHDEVPPAVSGLVTNDAPDLCDRYIGRTLEGVTVTPSPLAVRLRLERCGIRAINNLVDVTNYVLLEWGHPLHVFDRDQLADGRVVIRRARAGESLACLDGVTRFLDDALVIADAVKPAAVAGIMGGAPSAVGNETRRVLLESARFAPSSVRRTRGRLNLSTESSYRFERGTDAAVAGWAVRRATALILQWAGGALTGEQDVDLRTATSPALIVRPSRIDALLGFPVGPEKIVRLLTSLNFHCEPQGDTVRITPPPHRHDVRDTADVAEEVARLVGYDGVPLRCRAASQAWDPPSAVRSLADKALPILLGEGFFEASNPGLVTRVTWERFHPGGAALAELANPSSSAGECLSPDLLPGLLANAQTNRRHGRSPIRLFEIGTTFAAADDGVREEQRLAWIAVGESAPTHWKYRPRPLEIWDAKTWMKALLKSWRLAGARFDAGAGHPALHPSESMAVKGTDAEPLGWFGRLHPRQAESWDLPPDTFVGEIRLNAAATQATVPARHRTLSRFPAVLRDFSLTFPTSVPWLSVSLWLHASSPWVESVELFDVFTGKDLPEGERSLAFRVTFRDASRTLNDGDIGEIQTKILRGLAETFGAAPRSSATA
jgi:phenylalanyl-tRNA synthetase beta chain